MYYVRWAFFFLFLNHLLFQFILFVTSLSIVYRTCRYVLPLADNLKNTSSVLSNTLKGRKPDSSIYECRMWKMGLIRPVFFLLSFAFYYFLKKYRQKKYCKPNSNIHDEQSTNPLGEENETKKYICADMGEFSCIATDPFYRKHTSFIDIIMYMCFTSAYISNLMYTHTHTSMYSVSLELVWAFPIVVTLPAIWFVLSCVCAFLLYIYILFDFVSKK